MWLRGVGGSQAGCHLQTEIQIPVPSQGLFAGTGASWVASQAMDNGMPGSLPGEAGGLGILLLCLYNSYPPRAPNVDAVPPNARVGTPSLLLSLPHHGLCKARIPAKQVESLTVI